MKFTGIYIYVDGCDLDDFAEPMLSDLRSLIAENNIPAKVISDKFEKTPDMEPDDYPDWNLGLNLDNSSSIDKEIEILVPSVNDIAMKYKRDFVLGYYDKESNISEDIVFFGYENQNKPVVETAREILGI